MNIEQLISIEANKLLENYYRFYFKKYPRKLSQVKNKFMAFFVKAASMFCIRDGYNAEKLINAFMMNGFKFPQQLPNEKTWKTYIEYLPVIKEQKSEEIEVVESIVNTALVIKRFGSVEKWLLSPLNQKMVIEEKMPFGTLLLSFSTSFINFCEEKCRDNYDFKYMREFVKSQKHSDKIISKIKEILIDDYYLFNKEVEETMDKLHFVF